LPADAAGNAEIGGQRIVGRPLGPERIVAQLRIVGREVDVGADGQRVGRIVFATGDDRAVVGRGVLGVEIVGLAQVEGGAFGLRPDAGIEVDLDVWIAEIDVRRPDADIEDAVVQLDMAWRAGLPSVWLIPPER
jgi:hypothetical protein